MKNLFKKHGFFIFSKKIKKYCDYKMFISNVLQCFSKKCWKYFLEIKIFHCGISKKCCNFER